jgi:hypothetical protein
MSISDAEYPLPDVTITEVQKVHEIDKPLYSGWNTKSSPHEYFLHVPEVGSFYACNGCQVEYATEKNADPEWVRLCLNGQVLAALLHQRKIINFHASSFVYDGAGIMILGETGAGKSSLTAAFTLDGAGFITDDLTPVVFQGTMPYLMPLNRKIKLENNSIEQLDIPGTRLNIAEEGTGKHYMDVERRVIEQYPLNVIFKVETGDIEVPELTVPVQAELFPILRSEICSWEMLAGMPATESDYLHKILQIVHNVSIVKLTRPRTIGIKLLSRYMTDYLSKEI